jgi:hypothetical protein
MQRAKSCIKFNGHSQHPRHTTFEFRIPYRSPHRGEKIIANASGRACARCLRWCLTTSATSTYDVNDNLEHRLTLASENWGVPADLLCSPCPLCRLFAAHTVDYQYVNCPMEIRMYDLQQLVVPPSSEVLRTYRGAKPVSGQL